jgi:hypothetical protein
VCLNHIVSGISLLVFIDKVVVFLGILSYLLAYRQ